KWRQCKHRFCLELFPIESDHFKKKDNQSMWFGTSKRKDSKFCCNKCRINHFKSQAQFDRTKKTYDNPTYLPQEIINSEIELDASKSDRVGKYEISYQTEHLDALSAGEMVYTNL